MVRPIGARRGVTGGGIVKTKWMARVTRFIAAAVVLQLNLRPGLQGAVYAAAQPTKRQQVRGVSCKVYLPESAADALSGAPPTSPSRAPLAQVYSTAAAAAGV